MNEAQTTSATQTPAVPALTEANGPADVDSRAAQLIEDIRAGKFKGEVGDTAETVAEHEVDKEKTKEPEQAAETKGAGDEEAAEPQKPETDAEKERRERIARAQELERQARKEASTAAEDRRQVAEEKARIDTLAKQVAERDKAIAEREKAIAEREKMFDDGPTFLAEAKKRISPDQLGEWLADSMNPVKQAEWAAKAAVREAQSAPETDQRIAKLEAQVAEREAQIEQQMLAARQQELIGSFTEHARAQTSTLPYVGVLLEKRPHELLDRAEAAAKRFVAKNEFFDYNLILREVETELSGFASLFSPKATGEAAAPSDVANGTAAQAPRARTLTSRNSAGRSTIVEEDESLAALEDRRDSLIRRLRTSG